MRAILYTLHLLIGSVAVLSFFMGAVSVTLGRPKTADIWFGLLVIMVFLFILGS